MHSLKQLLPLLPESIRDFYLDSKYKKQLKTWVENGKKLPVPHIVKQLAINSFNEKYNIQILVETGTYLGDMVYAQRKKFKQIFTIELSEPLYKMCVNRLKKYDNITVIQGDSGVVLNSILDQIREKAIFWLDGHYSGGITAKGNTECPIIQELSLILGTNIEHIILIDDAREFGGKNTDYPDLEEIKTLIKNNGYLNSSFNVENDIIRIELKF